MEMKENSWHIRTAVIATTIFLALQVAILAMKLGFQGSGRTPLIVKEAVSTFVERPRLLAAGIWQVGVVLLLHYGGLYAFAAAWFRLVRCVSFKHEQHWFVLSLTLIFAAIYSLNSAYFPLSALSNAHGWLLEAVPLFFWQAVLAIFCLVAFMGILEVAVRYRRRVLLIGSALAFASLATLIFQHTRSAPMLERGMNPNIIVIGIDSLRPDFVFGDAGDVDLPTLSNIMGSSIVFSDTLTPIARTYPSWMTILSGKYPNRHGALFNLQRNDDSLTRDTLPIHLQKIGYRTFYATDESRFSNIDEDYGFEVTSTPPIGIIDFAVGTLLDFPATNLISQIDLLSFLFPYTYANRAAAQSYSPRHFSRRIESMLDSIGDRGNFLAVHFCLPHWPYFPPVAPNTNSNQTSQVASYSLALKETDTQVKRLIELLSDKGLLEDAVLVILSDHGESFPIPDDEYLTMAGDIIPIGTGHGTIAYSIAQYKVLLSFQRFKHGTAVIDPDTIATPASLVDVAPTVLKLAGLPALQHTDGLDLLPPYGTSEMTTIDRRRVRYTETDIRGGALNVENPDPREIMIEFSDIFQLKDDRVEIRPDLVSSLVETKQIAASVGDLTVALTNDGKWLWANHASRRVHYFDPTSSPEESEATFLAQSICGHFSTYPHAKNWCQGFVGTQIRDPQLTHGGQNPE